MKSPKRKNIVVMERDRQLLLYLFVNKVATVKDIHQDIFGDVSLSFVNRRLRFLVSHGLVTPQIRKDSYHRLIYSVTRKGFEKYIAEKGMAKRLQLSSDSVEHDLTVLKIKRRFRKFKNVLNVYSENLVRSGLLDEDYPELRQLGELRPDAVVKLKVRKRIYFLPLEYEASPKFFKRNAKLLSKYYTSPFVVAVLFVSKTDTIQKQLWQQEAARKSERKGRFYYAQLEDVLNTQERLAFGSVKDDILTMA